MRGTSSEWSLFFLCRIDINFMIKIADFGLSENVYARNYFMQGQGPSVKLPIKWIAPESLHDGIFSCKTDAVSHTHNS